MKTINRVKENGSTKRAGIQAAKPQKMTAPKAATAPVSSIPLHVSSGAVVTVEEARSTMMLAYQTDLAAHRAVGLLQSLASQVFHEMQTREDFKSDSGTLDYITEIQKQAKELSEELLYATGARVGDALALFNDARAAKEAGVCMIYQDDASGSAQLVPVATLSPDRPGPQ